MASADTQARTAGTAVQPSRKSFIRSVRELFFDGEKVSDDIVKQKA